MKNNTGTPTVCADVQTSRAPSSQFLRFRETIRFIRDNPGCKLREILAAVDGLTEREWRAFKASQFWWDLANYRYYPSGWYSPLMTLPGGPFHGDPKRAPHDFTTRTKKAAWSGWGDMERGCWPGLNHGGRGLGGVQ